MKSITSLSKYLIETAEITEQENGIYSCPIPHIQPECKPTLIYLVILSGEETT